MRALIGLICCLAAPASAQDDAEIRFVMQLLNDIQPTSIAENREYCGYIGYDAQGALASTQAVRGDPVGCLPAGDEALVIFASWHTHAAFDESAWSEVPSVDDIEADEDEGVDGYVSTPAGRVWYVDTTDMVVFQLCGPGCVTADPAHEPETEGRVETAYTYRELLAREAAQ